MITGVGKALGRGKATLWAVSLALVASILIGCDRELPPPSDPELREELGIPDDIPIHSILLSGRGDHTRVLPAYLEIRRGDLVQFRVMDRRVHQVSFVEVSLEPALAEFLEATGQLRLPPLTEQDARLVLTFEDAPEGVYPFIVEGYGETREGRIVLTGG